jgi:hypothetical protein
LIYDLRMTIYASTEPRRRHALVNCKSHVINLSEGRQIQAGCTCLENRNGIAEVGALPGGRLQRPFRQLNHQPTGDHHDHKHIIPQVAGTAICQATARAESPSSSEDSASAPNAAEKQANLRAFPG